MVVEQDRPLAFDSEIKPLEVGWWNDHSYSFSQRSFLIHIRNFPFAPFVCWKLQGTQWLAARKQCQYFASSCSLWKAKFVFFSRVIYWMVVWYNMKGIKIDKSFGDPHSDTIIFTGFIGTRKAFWFLFPLAHSSGCHSISPGLGTATGLPSLPGQIMLHLLLRCTP